MSSTITLSHNLHEHFESLSRFNDSKELLTSELYTQIQPEVKAVLNSHEVGFFAPPAPKKPFYRAVTWNIERGIEFDGILHQLANHAELKAADILLIPETDMGMARSANRNVAKELAEALGLNYFFVPTYINLSKGNGTEIHFEGDNTHAIHGNAILSRYPIKDFHNIPLHNAKDKMKGKEKRLGHQQAPACTVVLPQGEVRVICAHLDAHSSKRHRRDQMRMIMRYINQLPKLPTLFGGDLNTTTYNSKNAFWAIFGFWVRVSMGVRYVIAKHYPYPNRFFEKSLFKTLERHGFNYENWNEPGVCTLHYHVEDLKKIKNLRDLVPQWCFKFIDWACAKNNGYCSFKIDWFAARDLKLVHENQSFPDPHTAPLSPKVIGPLKYQDRECSDHDAILVDFRI